MVTRLDLRQGLALDTAADVFVTGTATGGNVAEFTLNELIDTAADAGLYRDRWVYRASDQSDRRITTYTPGAGAATVHRDVSPQYANGNVLEIHRWPVSLLHRAIEDGLARCKQEQWESVTLEVNRREYSLSSLTWLTSQNQVKGVYLKVGAVENETLLQQVRWAWVQWDNGVPTLRIEPPVASLTGYFLYLRLTRGYVLPSNDATDIPVDEHWARAAAKAQLYEHLMFKASPGRERQRWMEDHRLALKRFQRLSELNQPKFAYRLKAGVPISLGITYQL